MSFSLIKCRSVAFLFVVTWPVFCQSQHSPDAPLFPTKMAQCDKLQQDWADFHSHIAGEHQACLDAGKSTNNAANEPPETCSVPSCQPLHNRLHSSESVSASEVGICRRKVQQKIDEQSKRTKQDATDQAAREEYVSNLKDNSQRKKYGDFSEKHSAWDVRNRKRMSDIRELEDAAANIEDESQRHAALDSAIAQIARIKADARRDPEPKQNNQ